MSSKEGQLRVLMDMDGCLVDLFPTWLRLYGDVTKEYIHPDNLTHYGVEKMVSAPKVLWGLLGDALMQAPPVVGSSQFETMRDLDYYIVTYCHPLEPDALLFKRQWLAKWMPWVDQDRIVATSQKHLIDADVLVDDSEQMVSAWQMTHPEGRGLLMDAPYNRHASQRPLSWTRITEIVRLMADKKRGVR